MPLHDAAMDSMSSTSTTWGPTPATSNASTPFSIRPLFTSSSRARSKLASSNRPSRMRSSFIALTSLSWRHWSICSMDAASRRAPLNSSLSFAAMYASMRAFDPASSIRSIALSGRNRSAMYRCEMLTAASSAASVYETRWCFSYRERNPRKISTASSSLGSSTMMGWNRRSSAASFSMYLRCSSTVVAPMHCSSPRASGGLSKLEMSIPPPPLLPTAPAPTKVCTSSIIKITSFLSLISAIKPVTLDSSSPRSFAPAISKPTSSDTTLFSSKNAGTSPDTTRIAKPSAMAVLPTPGSPRRIGLFFDRRARICMVRSTSSSRPITGSMFPDLAFSVMSTQKSFNGDLASFCCCAGGACGRLARPEGLAPPTAPPLALPRSRSRSPFRRRRASVFRTSGSTPTALKNATSVTSSRSAAAAAMCSGAM